MLSDVFKSVTVLKTPGDSPGQLAYVVQPDITTTSSSSGILTWMATEFGVTIDCKFTPPAGAAVTTVSATGSGHAVFDELKSNFSLAGIRASQDVLTKLRAALLENTELKK